MEPMAAVVKGLKKLGQDRPKFSDRSELDEETRTLIQGNHFAFLIAVAFDRGMRREKAWRIPVEIKSELKGCLDPAQLASKGEPELIGLLEGLAVRPRWGVKQGAKTLSDAAKLVCERRFGGDAEAIWRDALPDAVEETLQKIHGVGARTASMATRILRVDFHFFEGQESQIDVNPGDHLVRVFQRLGIIDSANAKEAIGAAQRLNPEFPGELDWPAWEIGRRWCHPTKPDCANCVLTEDCAKRGVESDPPSPSSE